MYSGITKIYYRKTVRQVFTKPVQIEGTTQNFFPPVSCFSSQFTFLTLGYVSVCVVRKWPLRGRSLFVCWNITRITLWLLCNPHFVQITQRTCLQDLAYLRAWIIAAVKNFHTPMSTREWQELEYRIDVCRVTCGAQIEHIQLAKETFSVSLWL